MNVSTATLGTVFAQVARAIAHIPQALEVLEDYRQDAAVSRLTLDRLRGFLQGLSAAGALPYEDYCEVDAKLTSDEENPLRRASLIEVEAVLPRK